jgi:hypothetical protein
MCQKTKESQPEPHLVSLIVAATLQ